MRRDSSRVRTDPVRSLVGFYVGSGLYAVSVPQVREIIFPAKLVEVPHSPAIVLGVTDHRGRVVPVVDLRKRFGIGGVNAGRKAKWIVVEERGRWLGLVVDSVTEVFGVTEAHERTAPKLGPDEVTRGFMKVYKHESNLVLELDLSALVDAVESGGGFVLPPSLEPGAGGATP